MSHRRLFTPLLLALAALLLWCFLTHRWSVENWQTPLQFHGDPLEIYARVQAAAEDLTQPLRGYAELPRLAAPFGADWTRYPVSDRIVFTLLGALARGLGTFAAVNLAIAVTHVLNALAFYACARFLRWRREWAFALALLFSFSSYNFRWGVTVSFSLSFFIPPLLLLCGWIARSAPAVRARGWQWLALGLGVWLGGANPYFGFFAGQLIGLAMLLQFLRRRDLARLRAGGLLLLALGVSFLAHNAAYFLAGTEGASRLTLSRNYAGSEIYALKLSDLVIPPDEHHLAAIGQLGRAYQAQSALRTEFFVNYLGVFGLCGLALLIGAALSPLLARRRARIPDAALALGWTFLFSAVGGVNSLLALGGLDVFRASNRNSVFILVWALWFLGRWLQRQPFTLRPVLRYALPALVVAVGLYDAIPRLRATPQLTRNAAELRTYRTLLEKLETRLGAGARIFQVPAPPFPEAGVTVQMGDYEHFLPYLTSHSLRFSYGALRGTALSRGLRALARVPASILRDELEATGFHAIWIDRRGLPDNGEFTIEHLRALELPEFPQTELPDIVIFILNPADHPRTLDLTDPTLFEPWDVILTLPKPRLFVYNGWFDLERDGPRSWRWAQDVANTGIAMPADGDVELSFWAYSLTRGELVLELDGREIWRHLTTPTSRDQRVIPLHLEAGRHRLVWRFTGELARPSTGDGRLLGFAVGNLRLKLAGDDSPSRPPPPRPRSKSFGPPPRPNFPPEDFPRDEAKPAPPPSAP